MIYPKLFRWPPFTSVASVVERLALFPLIAGGLFMLGSGLANINLWYPWQFSFPVTHYWVAWITIGALVVHVGAKRVTTLRALRPRRSTDDGTTPSRSRAPSGAARTTTGGA